MRPSKPYAASRWSHAFLFHDACLAVLRARFPLGVALSVVTCLSAGCRTNPIRIPLEPLPFRNAVEIVNQNVDQIDGVLRASGAVDGRVTLEDGRAQSYHLDGVLFFLTPSFVRFDLKAFGERQLLFGSNAEEFWYYDKQAVAYRCGRHGEAGPLTIELPAPPDQIIEVLGLQAVPVDSVIHRVAAEYQQVLVVGSDAGRQDVIEREYWLDRCEPRLLRRVLFRDQDAVVTLEARYDDYARLGEGGPWLPGTITATWPQAGASMSFHIAKWTIAEGLGPDSIQFALPGDCRPQP